MIVLEELGQTIAILFDLCPKSDYFLGTSLEAIGNGQECQSLFLFFELSQPIWDCYSFSWIGFGMIANSIL